VSQGLRPLAQLLVDSVWDAGGLPTSQSFDQRLAEVAVKRVVEAATLHRVTPAVACHVGRLESAPQDWSESLGWFRHAQLIRHMRARSDLEQIQAALDAAGIVWVAVKGPVLSDLNWPRPDLREYYDLDVVVDRRRIEDVLRVLESAGCAYVDRNWPLLRKTMRAEIAMRAPSGTPLDLHWDLAVPARLRRDFRIDVSAMLARRRLVSLGNGQEIWALDPVDVVFHLAFHAAQAGVSRLVWPADVWFAGRELSRAQWTELWALAIAARAELLLALVLDRTFRLFPAPAIFDQQFLRSADRLWGRLARMRDRTFPLPGLPGDSHLGGSLYASARRGLLRSASQLLISRWQMRRLESPTQGAKETESEALSRDVPDSTARSDYLRRASTHRRP
jgi:hypothetical protein